MRRKNEIITGIFVLAGILLLVLGGLWLSGSRWGRVDRRLVVAVEQVGQLKAGNPVAIRGVTVGEVEGISLHGGEAVEVELRVRSDVALPPQPVAVLQPVSLFGDWQVAIVPGASRPAALEAASDASSDRIPGVAVSDFASISENTEEIARNLRGITDRVELAFDENTARDLSRAITNFGRASDELVGLLERQREEFGSFTADLAEAGEAVRQAAVQVDRTVSRLAGATEEGELEAIFDHARGASRSLEELASDLRGTHRELAAVIARADTAARSAQELLAAIEGGQGSLGRLTGDPVLYENTAAALAEFRALMDDLKQNPRKYFSFSIF